MASLISSRPEPSTYGVQLTFETLTSDAALRVRPAEDTLLRVIDGVISLRYDGDERLLGPAGEAMVPAGWHYTMSAISGEARIVMGYRAVN